VMEGTLQAASGWGMMMYLIVQRSSER